MVRSTSPSLPMLMKAFGAKSAEAIASVRPNGSARLNSRPPPAVAALARKPRRDKLVSSRRAATRSKIMSASLCRRLRGQFDRFTDTHISSAAADVAAHGIVDVCIGGMRIARQQRRGGHDLSRLTVAALNDLMVEPRLLDFCTGRRRADGFNRRNRRPFDAINWRDARPCRDAVDMHRAGAAQRRAATEFRTGHAEHVAQDP